MSPNPKAERFMKNFTKFTTSFMIVYKDKFQP